MGAIPHLFSTLNIKETQNYLPLQKNNWEQNSHSYKKNPDKNISLICYMDEKSGQLPSGLDNPPQL